MVKKEIKINLERQEISKTKKVTFTFYPETEKKLDLINEKLQMKGGKSAIIRGFIDDVYKQLFEDE